MADFEINLQEFLLGDVLQFLAHVRKSGVLRITGEISGEIYVHNGYVVHACDDQDKGMEALFNLSFVNLEKAVFESQVTAPEQTISEDVGKLTENIEKRKIEFEELQKNLYPMSTVLAKAARELESAVALRRTDWKLLALIDGKRTLAEVITEAKIGGYEATKTIIWLKEQGLVYDPREAERVMSRFLKFLRILFEEFGRNGLTWFKEWARSDPRNKKLAAALDINEETLKVEPRAELSSREITELLDTLREYVRAQGPVVFGRVLFTKKWQTLEQELRNE